MVETTELRRHDKVLLAWGFDWDKGVIRDPRTIKGKIRVKHGPWIVSGHWVESSRILAKTGRTALGKIMDWLKQ